MPPLRPSAVPGPGPPAVLVSPGGAAPWAATRRRGCPVAVRAAVLAAALVAGCRDPQAGPGKLSGADRLPLYRVARAEGPIEIDGRPDEAAWNAALQMPLVDSLGGQPPRLPTVARVLRDERHLFVAFYFRAEQVFAHPCGQYLDPC